MPCYLFARTFPRNPIAFDRGVPARRAPALRAPRAVRRGPSRRDADVAALGVPRAHRGVGVRGRSRVRDAPRAVLCAEPRRAGTADVRPDRQGRTYRSDKSDGPTAGTETVDPLEFLARVLVHMPDQGHVTTRYYGWYANRPRGTRRKAAPAGGRRSSNKSSRWTRSRVPPATARCASSPSSPN